MKLLCFDTSAKTASAAVVEEGKILAECSVTTGLTHSQTMMPLCESLLRGAGMKLSDMDLFAISSGPGSFTGLRIGIGTVKGLCMGCGKPCIGVSTLEALAYNCMGLDTLVCPVMDARCHQVYTALFEVRGGIPERLMEDCAISITELAERLRTYDRPVMLVGDGTDLVYGELSEGLPLLRAAAPGLRLQRAASVGFAALHTLETASPLSPGELMPQYLRRPQAERELLAKQKAAEEKNS